MSAPRRIEICAGENEDAAGTFARDQLMMLRCAEDAVARVRIWRRAGAQLLLGRFHRMDPASCAWVESAVDTGGTHAAGQNEARGGLSRRLSGGRIVPVGPGVVCITMAVPSVDWLGGDQALRPDQVLNRALRPLLAMLRGDGIDAFYPGRDLVTVSGRAIAHASFTVMRDGVAVIEMHVAETRSFADLPDLLDRFDPAGVAGIERDALSQSTSMAECGTPARRDDEWATRFADFAATAFVCDARTAGPAGGDTSSPPGASSAESGGVTLAHEGAARDFLLSPGPAEDGMLTAAAVSMLGLVECSARLRGDRVTGLRITGDLIAPFHTLDDVSTECEGEPFRAPSIRKALARAMARPRSFVLGLRELDELILRMD